MTRDVFLSYSTGDKSIADAACAALERAGITTWIAHRDIRPGSKWGESIIDAIGNARVMVLIFSTQANSSSQIEREVERAVDKGLMIIPFRIEDVKPSKNLEYFISTAHWFDAFAKPPEQYVERLADIVTHVINTPIGGAERGASESHGINKHLNAHETEKPGYTKSNTPVETSISSIFFYLMSGLFAVLALIIVFRPGGVMAGSRGDGPAELLFLVSATILFYYLARRFRKLK